MIISRAPLRMSFTWWWSDIASFYTKHKWAVVSTAINKYIYITINDRFDDTIRLSYSKTEIVDNLDQMTHNLVREALREIWIYSWIEITSIADIPSQWSWLWSSSTFSVALFHALKAYKKEFVNAENLAKLACKLEIEICKEPIWKQDQYASAYWWLNFIEFNQDWTTFVNPIICSSDTKKKLNENTVVFYTWITRSASNILKEQSKSYNDNNKKVEIMKKMVDLTYDLKRELENNNINKFWEILHENWLLKKQITSGISNDFIDEYYEKAQKAWAIWWKLLWAWWWWFLMFYAEKDKHEDIEKALRLKRVPVNFEPEWSKIIFIH